MLTEPSTPPPTPPAAVIVRVRSRVSSLSALTVPLIFTSPSFAASVLRVSSVTLAARITLPFSSMAPVFVSLLLAFVVRLSFSVMLVEAVMSMASPMVGASLPSSTETLSSTTVDAARTAR